jgi:hypothetical protein
MRHLTKTEAEKLAEITSSVYEQSNMWVLREWDLSTGTERLTRGLTLKVAKKRLKMWRKDKIEELLRADGQAKAFAVRTWHENPSWKGEGIWHWAQNQWYTTREDAEKAMEKKHEETGLPCEIIELTTGELPGHFVVG